jgi:hypothetical protein
MRLRPINNQSAHKTDLSERFLMKKIRHLFLFYAFALMACSSGVSATAPASIDASLTPLALTTIASRGPVPVSTVSTPHIDQPPDGDAATTLPNPQSCGYQWANQDLPELSNSLQESMRTIQAEAQASAYAFGENCLLADGSVGSFSAMETDFTITLQVSDLTDESALGDWIVKVMQLIQNIPQDQIVGPQPGRVSISFVSNGDQTFINFYINQYEALPAGLDAAEVYKALQTPQ